jgi:hypothetical protein
MTPTTADVLGKARAFVDGLKGLPRGVRTSTPHGHFARDLNTLRKLALEVAPGLDERLLGKYIQVTETPAGEVSHASYVEIEVYARQIVEQLAPLVHDRPPTTRSAEAPDAPTKAYNVAAIREDYVQAYAPWSAQDDEYLRTRFQQGAAMEDLVSEFGRKPGAIRSRLRKLGLDTPSE